MPVAVEKMARELLDRRALAAMAKHADMDLPEVPRRLMLLAIADRAEGVLGLERYLAKRTRGGSQGCGCEPAPLPGFQVILSGGIRDRELNRAQGDVAVRELVLDGLEAPDGLPELPTFAGIGNGLLECALGCTERPRGLTHGRDCEQVPDLGIRERHQDDRNCIDPNPPPTGLSHHRGRLSGNTFAGVDDGQCRAGHEYGQMRNDVGGFDEAQLRNQAVRFHFRPTCGSLMVEACERHGDHRVTAMEVIYKRRQGMGIAAGSKLHEVDQGCIRERYTAGGAAGLFLDQHDLAQAAFGGRGCNLGQALSGQLLPEPWGHLEGLVRQVFEESPDGFLQDLAILVRRQLSQHSGGHSLQFGPTILLLQEVRVNANALWRELSASPICRCSFEPSGWI